jgi:hypothetical protein
MKSPPRMSAVAAPLTALAVTALATTVLATTVLATAPAAAGTPAAGAPAATRAPTASPAQPVTTIREGRITVAESTGPSPTTIRDPGQTGMVLHASTPLRPGKYPASAHLYSVRVRILDRAGVPIPPLTRLGAKQYSLIGPVVDTATAGTPASVGYDKAAGAYTMKLPAGHYYLDGFVYLPGYSAVVVQPDVDVRGNVTITLDARAAEPVSVQVGHPGAEPLLDYAEIDQTIDGTGVSSAYGVLNSPGQYRTLYVTPTAAVTGRPFLFSLHASLTQPWAFPTAAHPRPASYEYNLLFTDRGSVPPSLAYRVSPGQLATVATRYFTQRPTLPSADLAQQANLPLGPGNAEYYSFDSPLAIPPAGRATLYYTAPAGFGWFSNYLLDDAQAGPSDLQPVTSYAPGHDYTDSFDEGALAADGAALRSGNVIYVFPAPFSPSEPGHIMPALSTLSIDGSTVHTTLSLNGEVIGRGGAGYGTGFKVPAARGRYTLTETATRPASDWSLLGTSSTATWSFFSGPGHGEVTLPLLTVRASGPFGPADSLTAGKTVPLSVKIENLHNGSTLTSISMAASFDGGKIWRAVRLYRAGSGWLAMVTSPPGGGYVSLRTSATDSSGDTAVVTTIRAYAVTAGPAGSR